LQSTRETGDWNPWLLYMLQGITTTSQTTVHLIEKIRDLMQDFEYRMRRDLPKFYSYELLNNLFRHPYTKIEAVQSDLGVTRLTASKYLTALTTSGFVERHRFGKYNYYVNRALMQLLEISYLLVPDQSHISA
jgi:Fic family protein